MKLQPNCSEVIWRLDTTKGLPIKEQIVVSLQAKKISEEDYYDFGQEDKVKDGWVYGEVKDTIAKTHPCLVPFEQLPEFQQKKDKLFRAIVNALK